MEKCEGNRACGKSASRSNHSIICFFLLNIVSLYENVERKSRMENVRNLSVIQDVKRSQQPIYCVIIKPPIHLPLILCFIPHCIDMIQIPWLFTEWLKDFQHPFERRLHFQHIKNNRPIFIFKMKRELTL